MIFEWTSIHSDNESETNFQNEVKEIYLEDFDTDVYSYYLPQMYDNNGNPVDNYDKLEHQLFFAKDNVNYNDTPIESNSNRKPLLYIELPDHLLDIAYFRVLKNMRPYLDGSSQSDFVYQIEGNYEHFPTSRQITAAIVRTKRFIKEGKALIYSLRVRDKEFERTFEDFFNKLNEELHDRYTHEISKYPIDRIEEIDNSAVKQIILEINEIIDSQESLPKKKRMINMLLHKIAIEYNEGIEVYNIIKSHVESNKPTSVSRNGNLAYSKSRQIAHLCICKNQISNMVNETKENMQSVFMMATQVAASTTPTSFMKNYHKLLDELNGTVRNYQFNISGDNKFWGINKNKPDKASFRCVAIIEFPDSPSRNMFSISGCEFIENSNPPARNPIFARLSAELSAELKHLGNYTFCEQNFLVRRFNRHNDEDKSRPKILDGPDIFTGLQDYANWRTNYQHMKDDPNWYKNRMDYSCCERKFLAKLEDDNANLGEPYPSYLEIFVVHKNPCPKCVPALEYYRCYGNSSRKVRCNYVDY